MKVMKAIRKCGCGREIPMAVTCQELERLRKENTHLSCALAEIQEILDLLKRKTQNDLNEED